jgi:hypothetical protein
LNLFNPVTRIELPFLLLFLTCGAATGVTVVLILHVYEGVIQVVAAIILIIYQLKVLFI